MRRRINFTFNHGNVEGMYAFPLANSGPLVVITNGHNGFYGYGMFPYIQDSLAAAGIYSYSYNFSHGGVSDGEDYFTDLKRYERNSMSLETLDLLEVLRHLHQLPIASSEEVFLLSHSLGSVPTLFAARDALKEGIAVAGVILIAPIKTLDVFPQEMMEEWEKEGVYYLKNNRTGQMLPQGPEFLSEIKASDSAWNVEQALKATPTRYLLVHGSDDKDVPVEHSETLRDWTEEAGFEATLKVVEGAGHTFNTDHPFKCTTPELDRVLGFIKDWIKET